VIGFVLTSALARAEERLKAYYPTEVGAKWVLRHYAGKLHWDETRTVTAVEMEKNGSKVVTVQQRSVRKEGIVLEGQEPKDLVLESSSKVRVSTTGFQVVATNDTDDKKWKQLESSVLFPYPLKDGDKWDHKIPESKYEVVYRVGKPERVKVPGGTFDAVPVYVEGTQGGKKLPKRTFWYAPGIGGIKSTIDDEVWMELVSFTLPKK